MKKLVYTLLGLLFICCLFLVYQWTQQIETVDYQLNGRNYRLLVANTPTEHAQGLMFVRELKQADGMLFIFPDRGQHVFWNKNTFMGLDVYWIQNDRIVGKSFLPSIENSGDLVRVYSPEKVNMVIEIPR